MPPSIIERASLSPQQALEHPHIRAAGFMQDVDYPGLPNPAPTARAAVRLSETPGEIVSRPPTLGEHTDRVLADLGYDAEAIAALRKGGIIRPVGGQRRAATCPPSLGSLSSGLVQASLCPPELD